MVYNSQSSDFIPGKRKFAGTTPTMVAFVWPRATCFPTIPGFAPKRRFHNESLIKATSRAPGESSSAVKSRPNSGDIPRTPKKSRVTRAPGTCSGVPGPVMLSGVSMNAAIFSNERLRACQSPKFCGLATLVLSPCSRCSQTMTRRSASGKGKGFRKTAFMTLNMAVLAPIPRTSARRAIRLNAGLPSRTRAP